MRIWICEIYWLLQITTPLHTPPHTHIVRGQRVGAILKAQQLRIHSTRAQLFHMLPYSCPCKYSLFTQVLPCCWWNIEQDTEQCKALLARTKAFVRCYRVLAVFHLQCTEYFLQSVMARSSYKERGKHQFQRSALVQTVRIPVQPSSCGDSTELTKTHSKT